MDVFDQVATAEPKADAFDVAEQELSRQQKAADRRGEAEKLLNRFKPVESPYDDLYATLGSRAGHELTKAALLAGGKKTDIALGVLAPLAATVASAPIPIPGSTAAAGASSSAAADALVQAREYLRGERDDFSKGRLLASGVTGAVVPPGVKAASTPLLTAAKTVGIRGAQGAGLGAAHEAISEAIDEGKLHGGAILSAGLLGTLVGAGFGTLEGAAPHIIKALRGKTVAEAKKVIAEELPKLDANEALSAAEKAEVRGVLEGAQKRIDDLLGVKPDTVAPTAGDSALARQANAEAALGGEAPITRLQKADERAAALGAARAEDVKASLLARQLGEGESTVLTGDEVQNQLTKLETRPGESRRERARLLAKQAQATAPGDEVAAELSAQADRVLRAEGNEGQGPTPVRRPASAEKPAQSEAVPQTEKPPVEAAPTGQPVSSEVRPDTVPTQATEAVAPTKSASNREIADQKRRIRDMERQAEKLDAIDPTRANDVRDKLEAERLKLAGMVANKKEGARPTVGVGPDGTRDILTDIAEYVGTLRTAGDSESKARLNVLQGIARRLRGGIEGAEWSDAIETLNSIGARSNSEAGAYNFTTAAELEDAISNALAAREKARGSLKVENYQQRVEEGFIAANEEDAARLLASGKGRQIEEIGVGGKFKIDGEKFSIVGVEETANGTYEYIVKDGHMFRVPEGTVVTPDKGKVTHAKRLSKASTDFLPSEDLPQSPQGGAEITPNVSPEGAAASKAEGFRLESVTNEQQAAEAAAKRERLLAQERKQKIETLAEKPLTGDSSDVGQGTLLAGDEDLFSGPSAETLAKKDQRGSIGTGLLFSTPLQSALGGVAGGVYGSTQGATPDERRQNMLLGAAAGAAGGAGLRIAGKAVLSRMGAKPVYEIDKHLAPPPLPKITEQLDKVPSTIKAATLSIYAPLDKLVEDVRKAASWLYVIPKRELPLSREFEQVAGAAGKAGQDVKDYVRNVLDAVGADDRQNFDRLVALKRIEQRLAWNDANASDRKVVGDWTHAKVAADLAKLEAEIGAPRVAELDKIASGIMQTEADDALRLQVQSGRLSQESYNRIKSENDFYAPFKVLDHLEGFDTGASRAVDTRDQLAKVIEGIHSTDFHIENPSVALAQHIFKGRILAEKNLKMLELAKLADNDVSGTLIRKLQPHDEPRRGYETVNYFDNGTPMRLEVKPDVAEAVKGLNATQAGWVANFARKAAGVFRFGATTGNVAFQPVNFTLADQPNVWLVSKYGLKGAQDIWRAPIDFIHGGYASIFSNLLGGEGGAFAKVGAHVPGVKQANDAAAKLAREFYESGAAGSNWQELIDTMGGTVDEKRLLGSLKLGEHSLLDSIGSINKAIEESSKMMGFKRGLRIEGIDKMTPAQAEEALKKVVAEVRNFAGSPDFFRSGWAVRDLNNLAQMFLNARVQGITNLTGRLAGADGVGPARDAWLRIAGTIGTGAAYLWYRNHAPENEADYNARSEAERKNYFLFPRYDESGKPLYSTNEFGQSVREYWRLPKREVLQYMGNTVESALDFAHDKDPDAVKNYGVQMLENLSPVNVGGRNARERFESVIGGANPLVKVPFEQVSGRDTFRHRDILPTDDFKRASPENQFTETTPKLMVRAAHAMPSFAPDNLRSPMMLQNLVEGASGRVLTQFLPKNQPEGRDPTAAAVAGNPLTARMAGSLYVDRSKEQEQIDTLKRAEADTRVEKKRGAKETISELKTLSAPEVSQRLKDIATNRPELFEQIITEMNKSERDVIDRQLLGLGVKNGARAQFIVGQLRTMQPDKIADYLKRLSQGDEAPLTPEVFEQVTALLGK